MESKETLRKTYRQLLKEWRNSRPEDVALAQSNLDRHLTEYLKNKQGIWGAFQALPDEPRLDNILNASPHIRWAFPRVDGSDLSFWHSGSFRRGSFQIMEPGPENSVRVPLENMDGLLIPGLAFDRFGFRLGRGKAYYDRTLINNPGIRVGVCFEPQWRSEALPKDSWDVPMNFVATDREIRVCSSSSEE